MNSNGDGAGASYDILTASGSHALTWGKTDKTGLCSLAACCLKAEPIIIPKFIHHYQQAGGL